MRIFWGLGAVLGLVVVNRLWPGLLWWLTREMVLELADREQPDLTWLTDDLAIGGRILDDEWSVLAKAGVAAVLDCRAEASDPVAVLEGFGMTFHRLPTPDSGNFTPELVVEGVSWIEEQWAAGRRILVHCQAGKGRSVLMGAAALTRRGFTPDDALALIRTRRPIITPTPGQIARLHAYARGYQLPLPIDA